MNCLRGRGDMEDFNDIPKYHKKGKRSKSNSNKRSNHKHEYEKIIYEDWFGYSWGKRCKICGRIDTYYSHFSSENYKDFRGTIIHGGRSRSMSPAEIRQVIPNVPIYNRTETGEYELVDI